MYSYISKYPLYIFLLLAPDPNAVPKVYLQKTYANKDYTNKEQGGLSFKRGSTVYVLLRNRDGWCTGMYYSKAYLESYILIYSTLLFLICTYHAIFVSGMSSGKYGLFKESAVSRRRPSVPNTTGGT